MVPTVHHHLGKSPAVQSVGIYCDSKFSTEILGPKYKDTVLAG